jgi:hypothetical protein
MLIQQSSTDSYASLTRGGTQHLTPPTLRNRTSYFCVVELDELPVTSISVPLANQRRHPSHLAGKEPNRSRGPSMKRSIAMLLFDATRIAAAARVNVRKPRAIGMVRHHLRSTRRGGREAVSSRYPVVIHPMEAGLHLGIRDKVGHRLLVVAVQARAEPNQPAAGCR